MRGDVSFVVAGSGYRNRQSLAIAAKICEKDDPVELVREASNQYDSNAIQVWVTPRGARRTMLGYVPRDIAARLAPVIDRARSMDHAGTVVKGEARAEYIAALVDPSEDFDPIRFRIKVST